MSTPQRTHLGIFTKLAILISSIILLATTVLAQPTVTYPETRKLLLLLEIENDSNGNLGTLFRTGDKQIENLVKALDDPDKIIRNNAQIVIRYLGNPVGMNALISSYAKSNDLRIIGPSPIPLSAWDYDFISSTFLNKPENFGQLSTQYLYALALDNSPKARELLPQMIKVAKTVNMDPSIINAINSGNLNSIFNTNKENDLSKAILKASNFLTPLDKEHATVSVISFNEAHDKALVKIYVNHGVLAEEFYHVVVKRCSPGWAFFSISLVGMS